MLLPHLPFADLNDIENNFQNVGLHTGFTLQQFIAQCIAFLVLFGVTWKFGWKPVRSILEERRQTIEQSMANADKIKQELSEAEATRLSILQKANEKANLIIAEAEKSAIAVTEQRAKEATRQAEDIVKNAREAAILDRNRLMAELKAPWSSRRPKKSRARSSPPTTRPASTPRRCASLKPARTKAQPLPSP
jgi:F-type H+-transporting ATPase subunit b